MLLKSDSALSGQVSDLGLLLVVEGGFGLLVVVQGNSGLLHAVEGDFGLLPAVEGDPGLLPVVEGLVEVLDDDVVVVQYMIGIEADDSIDEEGWC